MAVDGEGEGRGDEGTEVGQQLGAQPPSHRVRYRVTTTRWGLGWGWARDEGGGGGGRVVEGTGRRSGEDEVAGEAEVVAEPHEALEGQEPLPFRWGLGPPARGGGQSRGRGAEGFLIVQNSDGQFLGLLMFGWIWLWGGESYD